MVEPVDKKCWSQYQDVDRACSSFENSGVWSAVKGVLAGATAVVGVTNIYDDIAGRSGMSDYMTVSGNMLRCWGDHLNDVATTLGAEVRRMENKVQEDKFKLMTTIVERYHSADLLAMEILRSDVSTNRFMIYILFAYVAIIVWDRLSR